MSSNDTKIEWTHFPGKRGASWNFLRGCSRTKAPGAKTSGCGDATGGGCYAERDGARWCGPGQPYDGLIRLTGGGPRWTGVVRVIPDKIDHPLRHQVARAYFVNSVSDLFHEKVPRDVLDEAFGVMALTPHHVYISLTKRSSRMLDYLSDPGVRTRIADSIDSRRARGYLPRGITPFDAARTWQTHAREVAIALHFGKLWPLKNVIAGVSTENQIAFDLRARDLLATPAAVKLLSMEPLLEEVDPTYALRSPGLDDPAPGSTWAPCLCADVDSSDRPCMVCEARGVDWVIVGGESGPRSRLLDLAQVRRIIGACRAAQTPVFFKQAGAHAIDSESGSMQELHMFDVKGGNPYEWPEDVRVREFPVMP